MNFVMKAALGGEWSTGLEVDLTALQWKGLRGGRKKGLSGCRSSCVAVEALSSPSWAQTEALLPTMVTAPLATAAASSTRVYLWRENLCSCLEKLDPCLVLRAGKTIPPLTAEKIFHFLKNYHIFFPETFVL